MKYKFEKNGIGIHKIAVVSVCALLILVLAATFIKSDNSSVLKISPTDVSTTEEATDKNVTGTGSITLRGSSFLSHAVDVAVAKPILNPTVVSMYDSTQPAEPADSESEYIQIDLKITNTSENEIDFTNDFEYRTEGGRLLASAGTERSSSIGDKKTYQQKSKNVKPLNREHFLLHFDLKPGEVIDKYSIIFQIPKGDKGSLLLKDGEILLTTFELDWS